MSTDFFYNKIWKIVAAVSAVCFTAFCFVYALFLNQAKAVELQTGFFYLVREESNVDVGVEFVKLEGGKTLRHMLRATYPQQHSSQIWRRVCCHMAASV